MLSVRICDTIQVHFWCVPSSSNVTSKTTWTVKHFSGNAKNIFPLSSFDLRYLLNSNLDLLNSYNEHKPQPLF